MSANTNFFNPPEKKKSFEEEGRGAELLKSYKERLSRIDDLIAKTKETLQDTEKSKEETGKQSSEAEAAAVKDHFNIISNQQASATIKKALLGMIAGVSSGAIIVSTGGLGTPAAIATIVSLTAAGGLIGTSIGLTVEFLNEFYSIPPEKRVAFFKENPIKTSLFCLSATIAFCCAALYRLGLPIYGTLADKFAAASGVKNKEHLSKFADVMDSIAVEYGKNPKKFNETLKNIEKASSLNKHIHGLDCVKFAIACYNRALQIEKALNELKSTLEELCLTSKELNNEIKKVEESLAKGNHEGSTPQPT